VRSILSSLDPGLLVGMIFTGGVPTMISSNVLMTAQGHGNQALTVGRVHTREISGTFCDTPVNRSLHRLYFYGSLDMWPIGKTAHNRGGRQQRVICKRRPSKRSFTSGKMYLDHKNNYAVNHAICKSLHHLSF